MEPCRRRAPQVCNEAIELKRSTCLLERSALLLEMINLRVVPLDTAAEGVLALVPAHVRSRNELLVAEQEWVGRLCVAKSEVIAVGAARRCGIRGRLACREHEARVTVVQRRISVSSRVIRARDLQVVKSSGRCQIEGRPEPLARETEVPIDQQRRRERMSHAETDALNETWCIAQLSTVGRVTDRRSQQWRVVYERLRKAVAPEDHCRLAHDVVGLAVRVIAVEQCGAAANPIVQSV